MDQYNWTSAVLGLLIAGAIGLLIRRDRLHTRYALWWIPVAICIGTLGLFPRISDYLAALLGVAYPPTLFLLLGLGFVVIKILLMDIERSRNEVKLHRLAQRLAILEGSMGKPDRRPPQPPE